MTSTEPETGHRFPWLVIAAVVPALIALIALGTWQVQRLQWKEALLQRIETRTLAEPAPVEDIAAALSAGTLLQDEIEYRPAVARGRFDHDGRQFFFATHKGISGYYVYTPLRLAGPDEVLFVNRGFVPYDQRDAVGETEGTVQIAGLARMRLDAKPSWVVPDNEPENRTYFWKDLDAMAANAGFDEAAVLPFFLDAGFPDRSYPLGDWPVPGVTLVKLPNNHLQYAVSWYGLALTLVVVAGVFIRRRMRGA